MAAPAKRLRRRIAKRSARLLGRFAAPVTVFKTTGVLPCAEATTSPYILHGRDEPPLFSEPPPPSIGGERVWSTSHPSRPIKAHVACVPRGIALSHGAVLDPCGRFLSLASHDHDFADSPRRHDRMLVPTPHRFFPRIHKFRHEVVVLTTSNQHFYFHWIFDVLPRLCLAEQAGYGDGPFYIQADLPFQRQTLRVLGVSESSLIQLSKMPAISASNLIVPCHQILPGHVFPEWSITFLRRRILPNVRPVRRPSAKRLYISRKNAGHRRVTNESEITAFLSSYGFQPIQPEKLEFSEQVALFRDAEIVIAPHGGGLTNLVFCTPGARVIELFPPGNVDLYYRLATRLRLPYLFVKSRRGPEKSMGPEDYHIDVVDLKNALDAALPAVFSRTTMGPRRRPESGD